MSISSTQVDGDVWVIRAQGRLDQALTPDLDQALNDLLGKEQYYFIVDLADATYINSGGLRCLVSAWRRVQENEGSIYLCGLNPRLMEIFSLVGFDRVFQIYPSYEEASRHMQSSA